jgi:hypothetical protein
VTTISTATILNYILIPLGSALVGAVLKHLYSQVSSSSQPATPANASSSTTSTAPSAVGELEQLAMAIGQQALSQLASVVQGASTSTVSQPAPVASATPPATTTLPAEPSTPIRRHPILSAIHNLLSNPSTTPETAAPAVQALASQLPKN